MSPKSTNLYTTPFTVHTEKTVAESDNQDSGFSLSSCSTTPPFLPNSGLATSSGPLDQVIPRTQKPQSILHNSHHADSTPKAVNSRTGWSVFLMKIEERIQMHIICQRYNGKRGLYTSAPTAAKSRPTWEPISGCEYLVLNNGKGGPPKKVFQFRNTDGDRAKFRADTMIPLLTEVAPFIQKKHINEEAVLNPLCDDALEFSCRFSVCQEAIESPPRHKHMRAFPKEKQTGALEIHTNPCFLVTTRYSCWCVSPWTQRHTP